MGEFYDVGWRVRICPVEPPMRQPHPEHEGKEGTITGEKDILAWSTKLKPFFVPIITLDDGTVLEGSECWWEKI